MQSYSFYFFNPRLLVRKLLVRCLVFLPAKWYLSIIFRISNGYCLNWKCPRTYNEKLQYLKLYDHRSIYTTMVDKVAVKEYVACKIGNEYVIPNYAVWDNVEDINIELLPEKFVLKISHGGGGNGVLICKNKRDINIQRVRRIFRQAMKQDGAKYNKEWPYKNVPRRILAEKLLVEQGESAPRDYKVMCFGGIPKLIEFHVGRYSENHRQDFYDCDWNLTDITQGKYGNCSSCAEPEPGNLKEMLRLSSILSEGIPHCRVDWYDVKGKLYFGEITFFDGSGFCPFDKIKDDLLIGSWITLPEKTKNLY